MSGLLGSRESTWTLVIKEDEEKEDDEEEEEGRGEDDKEESFREEDRPAFIVGVVDFVEMVGGTVCSYACIHRRTVL